MRIIAGRLRGRNFDSPHSHKTHPMSEKMRGAMFNVLGDITDLTIWDAYGGSGAIAFEAISRGAANVLTTELDPLVAKTITANIQNLGIADKVQLIRVNASIYSKNYPHKHYDIVICDPPYDDIHPAQLVQLSLGVKKGGLLIISKPTGSTDFSFDDYELISKKNYGDGTLVFYRKS